MLKRPRPQSSNEGSNDELDEDFHPSSSSESKQHPLKVVDFPFILTTTGIGNEMVVTDAADGLSRNHWSCRSRKPDSVGNVRYHFVCTQCKQLHRDRRGQGQKTGTAPTLIFTKNEITGQFILHTHPWQGPAGNHICDGHLIDISDAKLLIRAKTNELRENLGPPAKKAYNELLQMVDERSDWDDEKKQRVKEAIGPFNKHERNFTRTVFNAKNGNNSAKKKVSTDQYSSIVNSMVPTNSYNDALVQSIERQIKADEISIPNNFSNQQPRLLNGLNNSKLETKAFDFSRYCQRRIALMYLYFGFSNNNKTVELVEQQIFDALLKNNLIRSVEFCELTRSSVSLNGSSGFRQVLSCTVRSLDANGEYVYWPIDSNPRLRAECNEELDYVSLLNQSLPSNIRVIGWAPTHRDFNSLFDCANRCFNYIFPRSHFNADLMGNALQTLVGRHDFVNFMPNSQEIPENTMLYDIYSTDLSVILHDSNNQPSNDLLQIQIITNGFSDVAEIKPVLSVLFEIGLGRMPPSILDSLFDSTNVSSINSYFPLASSLNSFKNSTPMCLFDCSYNPQLQWQFNPKIIREVVSELQSKWIDLEVKARQVKQMLDNLSGWFPNNTQALTDYVFDINNESVSQNGHFGQIP